MNHACLARQPCLPDQPGLNLSSEDPDVPFYAGGNTGWDNNKPPIGGDWWSARCYAIYHSIISQADADAQAAKAQLECMVNRDPGGGTIPDGVDPRGRTHTGGPGGWTRPGPGTPYVPPGQPTPPNGPNLELVTNDETACAVTCPDGTVFIRRAAAGNYTGYTKDYANAVAKSIACTEAFLHRICFGELEWYNLD